MLQLFHDITEDHAFRLAAFLVARNGGKDEYSAVRGRGFSALFINHRKAQRCPHRGKFEGSPFTICERDAWLSHMRAAFEEVGVDKKAMEDQMSILTYVERKPTVLPSLPSVLSHTHTHAVHVDYRYMVRFYGPFVDDRAERAAEAAQQKKELEAKAKSAAAAGCPVAHHSKPEDATCPSGAGGGAGASSHATAPSAAAQASTSGGSNKQKSKKRGVVESVKRLLQ